MHIEWSQIGARLTAYGGIVELMDDLGQAMSGDSDCLMLGGGNPAAVPAVQAIWRARMQELLDQGQPFDDMLGNYDTPQGNPEFLDAVVCNFNETYGWGLTRDNVAVTNGSQTAFFFLFNMLAGQGADGRARKILLPLLPEYLGYADAGMQPDIFDSRRPLIEGIDEHTFKYHIDFENLDLDDSIAAIAVSRPTNPSGNVLTDEEVRRLSAIAKERGIPLIIDNAYGAPFPEIIFTEATPVWEEHIVLGLSLSKLGLPGTRTGLIIACPEIIRALSAATGIAALANGNVGQRITAPLIRSGELTRISHELIKPFYRERAEQALTWFKEYVDPSLPWKLHQVEGALFFWLWCKDLPTDSRELYRRLKEKGVLVISGDYFFFGSCMKDWSHARECLRITTQPEAVVREGFRIIGEELRELYGA